LIFEHLEKSITCLFSNGREYSDSPAPTIITGLIYGQWIAENDSGRYLPASWHIVDHVLVGECGGLIQRMAEDRKSRVLSQTLDPSLLPRRFAALRRRVRLEVIFDPR